MPAEVGAYENSLVTADLRQKEGAKVQVRSSNTNTSKQTAHFLSSLPPPSFFLSP